MKKTVLILAITALFTFSCQDIETEPDKFTFTLNGVEMDFSENVSAGVNILNQHYVTGKKEGVGIVTIYLKDSYSGSFDETDYVAEDVLTDHYSMRYEDASENIYTYSSYDAYSRFDITLDKYDYRGGELRGEIEGKFSGHLVGSILNEHSKIDSVVIENGIFYKNSDN